MAVQGFGGTKSAVGAAFDDIVPASRVLLVMALTGHLSRPDSASTSLLPKAVRVPWTGTPASACFHVGRV